MYNLEYWIGKLKVETLQYNLPIFIINKNKKLLSKDYRYRLGKLKAVKI